MSTGVPDSRDSSGTSRSARRFWAEVAPILENREREHAIKLAAASGVLSAIEILGVLTVLPLAQAVNSDATPPNAAWLADRIGDPSQGALIAALAGIVASLFLLRSVLGVAVLRASLTLTTTIEARVATECFRRFLGAPYEAALAVNSAEAQRTLHDSMRRVFTEALGSLIASFGDRLVIVGVGVALVVIAPLEALAAGGVTALAALLYRRVAHRRAGLSSDTQLAAARRSIQETGQTLAAIREIRLAGSHRYFEERFKTARTDIADSQRVIALTEQLPRYLLEVGLIVVTAAVAAVAFGLREQADAVGVLAVFLVAGFRVLPSLNRVTVSGGKTAVGWPALVHVRHALAIPEHADDADGANGDLVGHLQLVHVTFTYTGVDRPALEGVSLDIPPGTSLGVIGPSGAGKTTLLGVMLGFLNPTEGRILVDGGDLATRRVAWQRHVGYLPQEVALLDDTIRANIEMGVISNDDQPIFEALRSARLGTWVEGLAKGLETEVGERGARLSGGQRQRIGLARALYRHPSVLVLDEATSALDSATEREILSTIDSLPPDITRIWVTHRTSAIRTCDRIIVLEEGRIVAGGPWEELVKLGVLNEGS